MVKKCYAPWTRSRRLVSFSVRRLPRSVDLGKMERCSAPVGMFARGKLRRNGRTEGKPWHSERSEKEKRRGSFSPCCSPSPSSASARFRLRPIPPTTLRLPWMRRRPRWTRPNPAWPRSIASTSSSPPRWPSCRPRSTRRRRRPWRPSRPCSRGARLWARWPWASTATAVPWGFWASSLIRRTSTSCSATWSTSLRSCPIRPTRWPSRRSASAPSTT